MYDLELIELLLGHKFCIGYYKFSFTCKIVITQVDDHAKIRITSQLINGISRVLQKILKYFNGTIISTSFVLPSAGVSPVIFTLDVNDSEPAKLSFGSSL